MGENLTFNRPKDSATTIPYTNISTDLSHFASQVKRMMQTCIDHPHRLVGPDKKGKSACTGRKR